MPTPASAMVARPAPINLAAFASISFNPSSWWNRVDF
jgi:hypothetical protein